MRKLLCADFSVSRACQLAHVQRFSFFLSFFFPLAPPSLAREGGKREGNILKRNLQKRHESYLTKIQPKQAQLGDYKCGGRSRAGSERSSSACFSPTAPTLSFFSRKRKQKGILCGGSVRGELSAGCQRWEEEGPRRCSPSCCWWSRTSGSWGASGVLASGWGGSISPWMLSSGCWCWRGWRAYVLPGLLLPGQPSH